MKGKAEIYCSYPASKEAKISAMAEAVECFKETGIIPRDEEITLLFTIRDSGYTGKWLWYGSDKK